MVVKAEYIISIQSKMNWSWQHNDNKPNLIASTRTISHLFIDVSIVKDVTDVSRSISNN